MQDDFDRAWALADPIPGWLTKKQGLALYGAAALVKTRQWAVEIGSHRGRSTIILASGLAPGARLLAVDPFGDPHWGGGVENLQIFLENLRNAGVGQRVAHYRGTSAEANQHWVGESIGLLFIDGAHDRRSTLIDVDRWRPFLASGGLIYFHDAFSAVGTTMAILQRHLISRSFGYVGSVGSLAMFQRVDRSVLRACIDTLRLGVRLTYFARNLVVKLAIRNRWPRIARILGHSDPGFPV